MGMKESSGLGGRVHIALRNRDGQVVQECRVNNLVTTAGREWLAKLFSGQMQAPLDIQIAVGSSDTPAQATDTQLGKRVDGVTATLSGPKTMQDKDGPRAVISVQATLPANDQAETQDLREAGIEIKADEAQTPILYNHVTFPLITRASNLEMTLTWEVIF